MKKPTMTTERQEMINYLMDRVFPKRTAGKNKGLRRLGWLQFQESLEEQPDAPLMGMFLSSKEEEKRESALAKL